MDKELFLAKWAAIDEQILDTVERHDKLIMLIFQYLEGQEEWVQSPCDADSVTSSPDSA